MQVLLVLVAQVRLVLVVQTGECRQMGHCCLEVRDQVVRGLLGVPMVVDHSLRLLVDLIHQGVLNLLDALRDAEEARNVSLGYQKDNLVSRSNHLLDLELLLRSRGSEQVEEMRCCWQASREELNLAGTSEEHFRSEFLLPIRRAAGHPTGTARNQGNSHSVGPHWPWEVSEVVQRCLCWTAE